MLLHQQHTDRSYRATMARKQPSCLDLEANLQASTNSGDPDHQDLPVEMSFLPHKN